MAATSRQSLKAFEKGVSMLEGFATHLPLARSALGVIQEAAHRISNVPGEYLSNGSLDDSLQWVDMLVMDNLDEGRNVDGLSVDPQASGGLAETETSPLQYIHTDSWLM